MLSSPNPVFSISISLISCFLTSLHSCVSHSCIHHLAVFLLALLISLTNVLFPDSIYKTPIHVCYSICLNLDFDYCSPCLLGLWSLQFQFDSNFKPNMSPALQTLYLIVLVMQLFETTYELPKFK